MVVRGAAVRDPDTLRNAVLSAVSTPPPSAQPVRAEIASTGAAERRTGIPEATARYSTLYIDPPWHYSTWSNPNANTSGLASQHYGTMSQAALVSLPMQNLMAADCAVLLWATWPTLEAAFALGFAWGLTYKTCAFNWVKLNKMQTDTPFYGMGYWTRANSEPCLLFTKGHPCRKSVKVPQLMIEWEGGMFDTFETETIATPIGRHSEKPQAIYERIEALLDGPYCEVFARKTRPGWTSIGNEIDGRDIRDVLGARVRASEG